MKETLAFIGASAGAVGYLLWKQRVIEAVKPAAELAVPKSTPSEAPVATATQMQPAHVPKEIIPDPEAYAKSVDAIIRGGPSELVLILDFDRTITTMFLDGSRTEKGGTCHGIVESTRGKELLSAAQELNKTYYPIEIDPSIPLSEKVPKMEEWYSSIHKLLLDDGLQFSDVESSVAKARLRIRDGVLGIFEWCERHAVPLLVFSAGIGDVLREVLRQRLPGGVPSCVHIVSNMMVFDEAGRLTGFSNLIHMFNKHAGVLDPGTLRALSSRKHVILAGDSLGDATMAEGLPCVEAELRFGLLNDGVERLLGAYTAAFDVVLTEDAPLTPLLALLQKVAP